MEITGGNIHDKKKAHIWFYFTRNSSFSPMLLSVINKGNKHGELKLNPNYYNSPNEELFVKETDK